MSFGRAAVAALVVGILLPGCGGGSSPGLEATGDAAPAAVREPATGRPGSTSSEAPAADAGSGSERSPDRAPTGGKASAGQTITPAPHPETDGAGISLPANSAAVRDALRSSAARNQDKNSPNSVQSQLQKMVSRLRNGGHVDSPAAQGDAPTAVVKALKQLQEMQSP